MSLIPLAVAEPAGTVPKVHGQGRCGLVNQPPHGSCRPAPPPPLPPPPPPPVKPLTSRLSPPSVLAQSWPPPRPLSSVTVRLSSQKVKQNPSQRQPQNGRRRRHTSQASSDWPRKACWEQPRCQSPSYRVSKACWEQPRCQSPRYRVSWPEAAPGAAVNPDVAEAGSCTGCRSEPRRGRGRKLHWVPQ